MIRSEFGGPSVAVRGGIQVGGVETSSIFLFRVVAREETSAAPPWRLGAGFTSEVFRLYTDIKPHRLQYETQTLKIIETSEVRVSEYLVLNYSSSKQSSRLGSAPASPV